MYKCIKAHWAGILYGILLTGFTVYLVMDTFMIAEVYSVTEETIMVS